MTPAETAADAQAILGLMNLPRVGSVTIHRILDTLAERDTAPRFLLDYDTVSLVDEKLLTEPQAEMFASDEQRQWRISVLDHLDATDVGLIPYSSSAYPRQLWTKARSMAPPLLMVRGNDNLLHLEACGLAFAGARKASPRGLELTRMLVATAVEHRFTIVSGGARGTDATTHEEALAHGGSTIVVLAEGICTTRALGFSPMIEEGDTAVVSTFLPHDPWQAWQAMARNLSILGLCDRLVVIEAGDRGGTLAAGREAIERDIATWVLDYPDPPESASGNRALLEEGAMPIPVAANGEITVPPELFAIDGWVVNEIRPQTRSSKPSRTS